MPDQIPDDQLDAIAAALYAGNKIQAIKLHREATGWGLKESKDACESLESELRKNYPERFRAPQAGGCGKAAAVILGMFLSACAAWILFFAT